MPPPNTGQLISRIAKLLDLLRDMHLVITPRMCPYMDANEVCKRIDEEIEKGVPSQ